MPKGGTITLTTEEVLTADVQRRFPDACGFRYVVVSVSDTGSGIDQKTMSRIFEPFFTTKEKGKGTGLGLAVVYGIVKSHRGFIDVKSEPGRGTTFALYLPLFIRNDDEMITSPDRLETLEKGNETILVVEDEEMLLSFLESLLKSHGYTVLTADNGKRAVEMYAQRQQEIEVVLSDIGLPKMDGSNAFLKMKQINPDVKVILASGYCEPQVKADLIRSGVKSVISKPYLPKEILKQIRAALN
jgi:CheY-like chemotaxis protein